MSMNPLCTTSGFPEPQTSWNSRLGPGEFGLIPGYRGEARCPYGHGNSTHIHAMANCSNCMIARQRTLSSPGWYLIPDSICLLKSNPLAVRNSRLAGS